MIGNLGVQTFLGKIRLIDRISLSLAIGILANLSLVLLGFKLATIQWIILVLSIVGAAVFIRNISPKEISFKPGLIAFISYGLLLFFFKETAEGFIDWDARSIWLFNSKMILNSGGLTPDADILHSSFYWSHPDHPEFGTIIWSHPGYPKLIPAMAAQIANFFGYWNDYLPKISIFLVLSSALLMVSRFASLSLHFIMLLLTFFCTQFALLWNGYMDGMTAMFSGLTAWMLMRFQSNKDPIDFISAVISTSLLLNLKNEGSLLTLCIWMIFGFILRKEIFALGRKYFLMSALLLSPALIWGIRKSQLKIPSEFNFISSSTLERSIGRITDGTSMEQILSTLLVKHAHTWKAILALLGVSLVIFLVSKTRKQTSEFIAVFKSAITPTLIAIAYLMAMILVYVSTPYLLSFHLNTSVDRTMIVFYLLILLSIIKMVEWVNSELK